MTARQIKPFDVARTPLRDGTALIEASAGTGKTYTIAELVLRLILERDLTIDQILVTTFTELATAELRDRIRRRLREAFAMLTNGDTSVLPENAPDLGEAMKRLDLAIRDFDEAAICTIHGFCQRMLRDRAFESGTLFDAELITDDSSLLREVADDFWRREFYVADGVVFAAAARSGLSAEELLKVLGRVKNNPAARVIPVTSRADFDALREELVECWAELCNNWSAWDGDVREIFQDAPWAKHSQGKPETMAAYIDSLAKAVGDPIGDPSLGRAMEYLSRSSVEKAVRKGHTAPDHPLFDVCQRLLDLEPRFAAAVRSVFCEWARAELPRRKLARNVLSFDDLLLRLDAALAGPESEKLIASIRRRYKAALLDEFQDTDPVQERIFRRIYQDSSAPVYLIGDPKQAIYGFRGADVFAYLDAGDRADETYTLGSNWRSETPLVEAVNELFSVRDDVFVLEGIVFRRVKPAGEADENPLTIGGKKEPPFRIWTMFADKPLTNRIAKPEIARATAAGIASLLAANAKIGGSKVRPGSIAVLVSDRYEARMIQKSLGSFHVPGVLSGAANVFESHEAGELQRVLAGAAEPSCEDLVRCALATDMLGFTGSSLDGLARSETDWNAALERFARYHGLWKESGFVMMLRTLFLDFGIRARLLGLSDGERRLTNLLHLAELTQAACVIQRLGIIGTQKWFGTQMQDAPSNRDEHTELRLERDDEAVRILTVHASKGLEFDIVFCPFLWGDGKGPGKSPVACHDGSQLTLAFGDASNDCTEAAQREYLAERVRLLYVALTRAKHGCTMVWGDFEKGKKSACARLFENTPPEVLETPSIVVEPLPEVDAPRYAPEMPRSETLKPRTFSGSIDRSWGISSFTGLTREHVLEPEPAAFADDEPELETVAVTEAVPLTGIAAFPRGKKSGTCLHEILEELDFTDETGIPEIVERKLRVFGLAGNEEVIGEAVRRTLDVSLDGTDPEFVLSRVPRAKRLTELEFHFPVSRLTAERLSAFRGGGWRLAFPLLNGFLKGYIDLVIEWNGRFHIVDWKSNWLGPTPDSYKRDALASEMQRQQYRLQLHLYAVALHRYLGLRLPAYEYDVHFGGVFYVFVRGIDPARPELGIYRERPEARRIGQLNELLGGAG